MSEFREVANIAEARLVNETITQAFSTDPTWQPLLIPNAGDLTASNKYWWMFVNSARRFNWSFTNDSQSVAAIWYPPGESELTAAEAAGFEEFVTDLFGKGNVAELLATTEKFELARPADEHFYLTLLGVHPSARGKGLGMRLLAENLRAIDALGIPSYLESSNNDNDPKYEAMGYRRCGRIDLPSGRSISTYWREPAAEITLPWLVNGEN